MHSNSSDDHSVELHGPRKHTQLQEEEAGGIHVCRKIAYGFGAMPVILVMIPVGFFYNIFCLETVQLQPRYLMAMMVLGQLADAVTDPLIGYLVSRTRSRRFGPFKPWIVVNAPILAVVNIAMFYAPSPPLELDGQLTRFFHYLVMLCLMHTFTTAVSVPYMSMIMSLGRHQHERDSLSLYRSVFEFIGNLLAVAMFGSVSSLKRIANILKRRPRHFYHWMNATFSVTPLNTTTTGLTTTSMTMTTMNASLFDHTRYATAQHEEKLFYLIAAISCSVVIWLSAWICAFGTKQVNLQHRHTTSATHTSHSERFPAAHCDSNANEYNVRLEHANDSVNTKANTKANTNTKRSSSGYLAISKAVIGFRPYQILLAIFTCNILGVNVLQHISALYITHTLQRPHLLVPLIFCMMVCSIGVVLLSQLAIKHVDKKPVYWAGVLMCLPICVCFELLPVTTPSAGLFVVVIFVSAHVGVSLLLPWSMLTDVIDEFSLRHEDGLRHEPIFYSFFVFFANIATGLTSFIINYTLHEAGYDVSRHTQSEAVSLAIKRLNVILPASQALIVAVLLVFYPINARARRHIKVALIEKAASSTH